MAEIDITWDWVARAPLHVGSGLSQPGIADRLVQRDSVGRPVIGGDAVKGAIRMAAEQFAGWLGHSQHDIYRLQQNAEPQSQPLAQVFGGGATARCTPGIYDVAGGSQTKRAHVVAATAINHDTGTADEGTLRKTEIVPAGARFRARYTVLAPQDSVDAAATLLVAALLSVESIGARAGIGWGHLDLENLLIKVDGKPCDPAGIVSDQRIEILKKALAVTVRAGSKSSRVVGGAAAIGAPQWFELHITLEEPACLPGPPETSNTVATQDWIAATTLRGAVAGAWRRSGCAEAVILAWLSDDTAWTPAFRVQGNAPALPAPRSFVTTKRSHGGAPPGA